MKWTRRTQRCSCGYERDAHRHYRQGTDCALCECPHWSPPNPVYRLLRRRAGLHRRDAELAGSLQLHNGEHTTVIAAGHSNDPRLAH
jgi:hypothetical protein